MGISRKILKSILSLESSWAIKKHNIELIVVTGFFGSEIVREGIYEILKSRYHIRRNINQITWDMSIPLAVLGYKDKKRNVLKWMGLIVKAFFYLLFGPQNKHILVLNANCTFKETAKFWSSFLKPDYLIVLNYERDSKILETLLLNLKDTGTLIYNNDEVTESKLKGIKKSQRFSYGSRSADLNLNQKTGVMQYGVNKFRIPQTAFRFSYSMLAAIFALALKFQIDLKEAGFEAIKFDLTSILTSRIKSNIDRRDK